MFRNIRKRLAAAGSALVIGVGGLLSSADARAELRIDITKPNVEPLRIAITDLFGPSAREAGAGRRISGVIANNLRNSGLFAPIDKNAFIQTASAVNQVPRFGDWRQINAPALVHGRVRFEPDGQLRVEFRLWDVFAEQQMAGAALVTEADNWRRIAHVISDMIYERMTGETGYFDTRIVYISEQPKNAPGIGLNPLNPFGKRLAIMDQDGENHSYLTDGRTLVLTPRFSPTQQEITYLSYFNNVPRVYIFNIDTGRQEVLGDFPGMTFAPRFSPDGKRILLSMARNGNSDIFVMDLRTRQIRRLTRHGAIDTSPSMSPDGKRIVFNSDRGGTQQLYVMEAAGKGVRRISFGKGRYATPVWSPRGDLIAFTKISRGRFFIGVMKPDGSSERLLAEDFKIEGPTWSPNGRVLMFFRKGRGGAGGTGGQSRVYSIDLTGSNEREIPTPMDGSDPAWSPLSR